MPEESRLTPIDFQAINYVPGARAPWFCSPEPCFGPDELGEYAKHIEEMVENFNRADSAARIWEVMQAWEMRLFNRNYQFLNAGWKGWGMFGGSSGTSGAAILQTQNAMKLFACNVFGARHDKIVAALSREVPGVAVVAKDENDPIDQAAQEEAEKYLKVYANDSNLKKAVTQTASYFYTDDRVLWLTYTVADQSRWGTEVPDRPQEVSGAPEADGITPETELEQPSVSGGDQPARREETRVFGKLESKVPLMADEEHDMQSARAEWETSQNLLKAKYPWVRNKIATGGGSKDGQDQIARLARINVRLAVQSSSSSGESYKNDATESVTFFRPSEYEGIKDDNVRQIFYDEFPDGMEVWHAGGQLAMVRNCAMSKHVKIGHPAPGSGQNRRAIGTNYLPLQKILNANISLWDRYCRSAVARRFSREPFIDTQLLNSQANDPAKVTPVYLPEGSPLKISDITGVENVAQPNDAIFQFIQWLIEGAPEIMDNATPAMFGMDSSNEQTAAEATQKRDQALQVFSMPWGTLNDLVSGASLQAIESAAANRQSNISASLPGQQRLEIEIEKLQGSVLAYPESLEIPRTLAEQEEQMQMLIEQSPNVALYSAIINDPRNLALISKFPSLADLDVPGADQVEQQQGEFEILMRSGPMPNPQYAQIQEQIQQGEQEIAKIQEMVATDLTGTAQQVLAQHQQAMEQLQQLLQQTPPELSTVQVAQDTSENHEIHASITLGMLTSPTGRKLKNGNEDQKAIWQNLKLHWQEHMDMAQKLSPPKEMEFKGNVSIDPSKFPADAQSKMFQAMGLEVPPDSLKPEEQTHEITQEQEGIDANGIPTKTKVAVTGAPLK